MNKIEVFDGRSSFEAVEEDNEDEFSDVESEEEFHSTNKRILELLRKKNNQDQN